MQVKWKLIKSNSILISFWEPILLVAQQLFWNIQSAGNDWLWLSIIFIYWVKNLFSECQFWRIFPKVMTFRWRLCLQLSPLPPPPRWCSHQRMVKTQRLSSPLDPIGGHHKQKYFHMSYISSIQYFRTWVHRYLRRVFKGSPPVSLSPSAGSTFFRQKYFFTIWILFGQMHFAFAFCYVFVPKWWVHLKLIHRNLFPFHGG